MRENSAAGGDDGSPLAKENPIKLKVDTAYIEANGAWLEGTPDVTTKIGRFGTNYSDWVANIGDRDGVELSNVESRPRLRGRALCWVNDSPFSEDYLFRRPEFDEDDLVIDPFIDAEANFDWRIMAVKASGELDVVNVSGVYVMTVAEDDKDRSLSDYAVTASVTPVDGLKLDATFAGTNYQGLSAPIGDEKGTGYKVAAELSTVPNLTLSASSGR